MSEYSYDLYEKHKDEIEFSLKTIEVKAEKTKFMTWTPTAIELWNDKKFIEKRIEEQQSYIQLLTVRRMVGELSLERFTELVKFAQLIWRKFEQRLIELK